MKKVFLDKLPKWEVGTNKGKINWAKCLGSKVKFIYDGMEGWIEIVDKKDDILYVKYKDEKIYKISTYNFRMCQFGMLLNKITGDFRIEIGQTIIDDKRDIIITDREIKIIGKRKDDTKYYKYKCNKCGNEDWIYEGNLLSQKIGCNACCFPPQKVVLGINTIWDTDRWMCGLGVSEEDAKTHTKCTHKRIEVACPDCKRKRIIIISDINRTKSISCICGDGFPYPEKFMYSVLKQLNVHFKTEVKFDWCKYIDFNDINKIKKGRYDFVLEDTYIGNKQVIIETDGGWHGKDNKMSGIKKEESEYIDFTKDILANDNGYKVIRINCNSSDRCPPVLEIKSTFFINILTYY